MSIVVMECPVCGYHKCYQKRGRCRCGQYLINADAYAERRTFPVSYPERTWLLVGGEWVRFCDLREAETHREINRRWP